MRNRTPLSATRRLGRGLAASVVALLATVGATTSGTHPSEAVALTAPTPSASTAEGLTDPFFTYDRPARYDVVREDVLVPVRDGSHIACQLYRPGDSPAAPAAGRFPGIVYEYTAYASQSSIFGQGAAYFVRRGYNALVCQARGSGASPGVLDPFSAQEQRDNYDVIEWLADHPASTGRIGQMGVSYGGHSSLLVAVNQPPHLRAIIPMNGIHDWYENTIYRGGIYSPRIRPWQASVAPTTLQSYAEHPLYDGFWRERSVMARWDKLTIPTLEINGWYDRYRDGMVKNHTAQPEHVWLVSGPWEHGYPDGQHAAIGSSAYLAWWDHWLRQDPNAPLPQTKVTSYETPGPGTGTGWHQYAQWPPRAAREQTLPLTVGGRLDTAAGRPGAHNFTVNTDQQPAEAHEHLTYTTEPLRHDVVLAGDSEALVRASFTAKDGNIAAILYDVAPDGTRTRVTEGWLKASHRAGHERLAPVVPGHRYDIPVHIWPIHYRFASGHRILLTISSDDYPQIDSDAPAGSVTVDVGPAASRLTLTTLEAVRIPDREPTLVR